MKVYIIIILIFFSICHDNGKNVKEDETLLGSIAALLSQLLSMNSRINLAQSQQTKFSSMRAQLIEKLNSLEKKVENIESTYSYILANLYKQLAICQTDNKKAEIKNQIEQKNKSFKEELVNYNQQILEIEEKIKAYELQEELLNSIIDELNKASEDLKKNILNETQDTKILS